MDDKLQAISDFMKDCKQNIISECHGGQLGYTVVVKSKALLFNSHLEVFEAGCILFMELFSFRSLLLVSAEFL
jgi:hypothetical protein